MQVVERHAERFDGTWIPQLPEQDRGEFTDGSFLILQSLDQWTDGRHPHLFNRCQQVTCSMFALVPPIRIMQSFHQIGERRGMSSIPQGTRRGLPNVDLWVI